MNSRDKRRRAKQKDRGPLTPPLSPGKPEHTIPSPYLDGRSREPSQPNPLAKEPPPLFELDYQGVNVLHRTADSDYATRPTKPYSV